MKAQQSRQLLSKQQYNNQNFISFFFSKCKTGTAFVTQDYPSGTESRDQILNTLLSTASFIHKKTYNVRTDANGKLVGQLVRGHQPRVYAMRNDTDSSPFLSITFY